MKLRRVRTGLAIVFSAKVEGTRIGIFNDYLVFKAIPEDGSGKGESPKIHQKLREIVGSEERLDLINEVFEVAILIPDKLVKKQEVYKEVEKHGDGK